MAFYGCEFSFNGISCTEYGLMMYDFGTKSDTSNTLSVNSEIVEDRIRKTIYPVALRRYYKTNRLSSL